MRVLIDTNVLAAAFISHGISSEVFEQCVANHQICSSDFILEELVRVLVVKFGFSAPLANGLAKFVRKSSALARYDPKSVPKICRDPDDNHILAAARSVGAHCILTGDKDLLVLENFGGIPILNPSDFWRQEVKPRS